MGNATKASILHERPQVDDDFQKSNIDYENLIIENGKIAVKGMVFAVIFSIPIWILIISFIIWVIP